MNRIGHMVHGNMFKGAGKSKGKAGKSKAVPSVLTAEERESQFLQEIQDSLPDAALRRTAPALIDAEWSAPTRHHSDINSLGGVCIAPKSSIPDVLKQVGFTRSPTAMVCTQHPQDLGLRGYPSQEISCNFRIKDSNQTDKVIRVKRHLIQLGFGEGVTQSVDGDLVELDTPMHKITLKFPSTLGWTTEQLTVANISRILSSRIPAPAFDHIVLRLDYSATVMVHESEVGNLLKSSGCEAVFFKLHDSSKLYPNTEILWLPCDFTLDDANELAGKDASVYGIVAKNSRFDPRFAARFIEPNDLKTFHRLEDLSSYGRWRLTGLPLQCGTAGALSLLQKRGWEVKEILYFSETQCSFLAVKKGNTANMYHMSDAGTKCPLHIKAINAVARDEMAAEPKAAAVNASTQIRSTRPDAAQKRNEWLRTVVKQPGLAAPASPRQPAQTKRPGEGHTGNTPDGKKPPNQG